LIGVDHCDVIKRQRQIFYLSIVAFGLCFHVLSSDHDHFADPLTSFMCTLAMMVGEFNFGDLFVKTEVTYNGTTQIMFVLFLVLVSSVNRNYDSFSLTFSQSTERRMAEFEPPIS
jgi:hypothetical protein